MPCGLPGCQQAILRFPVEERHQSGLERSRTARDETVEDEIGKNTQNEGDKKDRPPAPADGQPKDQEQERRENKKDHGCWARPLSITSHQSTAGVVSAGVDSGRSGDPHANGLAAP